MSVTVDMSSFNSAVAKYKEATGKTLEQSCNRQLKNLLIMTGKNVIKVASKEEIEKLKDKPWYNRLITKLMKNKVPLSNIHTAKEQSKYWQEWKKIFRTVITKRVRAMRFLQILLYNAANAILAKDAMTANKKFMKGNFVKVHRGSMLSPYAGVEFGYSYEQRLHSGAKAEKILVDAINLAIPMTISDMLSYTAKKLQEKYNPINFKG